MKEVIGEDLGVLLPEPYGEFHDIVTRPRVMTGGLFNREERREVFLRDKRGFVHRGELKVRMNKE